VWGAGIGFAIVTAGTLPRELANFFAFRWCLLSRAEKFEKKNIRYSILSYVLRKGGWKIAVMARLSVIPPHCTSSPTCALVTTAIFAMSGMYVVVSTFAAIQSLPKQFSTVYLGVSFDES
ncbi:hypothetical protein OF83DRAFT_1030161, partial [Amylostereum chailletii]